MKENIQKTFPVTGMSCAACAARIEKTLNEVEGVAEARVNYASSTVFVTFAGEQCSVTQMKSAVQRAGYVLLTDEDEAQAEQIQLTHYKQIRQRVVWAALLCIPIFLSGMLEMFVHITGTLQIAIVVLQCLLATLVVFRFGRGFFINAWKQLRHQSVNMDTLVAGSTGIAYLFSLSNLLFFQFWVSHGIQPHFYFESASMIIVFILLGRLLEAKAKRNTSDAIRKLIGLQPKTVTIVSGDTERTVPIADIHTGDVIIVRPGEKVAVDGTVISGDSFVDESMLSGEPLAVHKQIGSKVFAGTLNRNGAFRFRADKVGKDTMLSRIIHHVQDAQGSKAPVQKTVDKVSSVFVPTIMAVAAVSFVAWMVLAPEKGLAYGLLAMITTLIIACPCALGLATPTALMVGIGKGAERGILIKDAESIETARLIDCIVLDKTGTITEGKPAVSDMMTLLFANEEARKQALSILRSIERKSEHPLAQAIVHDLATYDNEVNIMDFESITGSGVTAIVNKILYFVGRKELLTENEIDIPEELSEQAEQWAKEAKTIVWFGNERQALAVIAITDKIKTTSAAAIKMLHARNISVYMLTGDNEKAARAIAGQVGIKHVTAGVLPEEKVAFIKELQKQGHKVAMVGDGINDSAALAHANVSIAMGNGSDIAIDAAMVTILSSDLTKIAETIQLSEYTVRTIRENLFWAFVYNIIAVPVAAGILYPINGFLLNPMIGGAAMAMSSVSVVLNSLRLKRKKIGEQEECGSCPTNEPYIPRPFHIITAESKTETVEFIPIEEDENEFLLTTPSEDAGVYNVEGMMCDHCRTHVEEALNSIPGVSASVTLDPPIAIISFAEPKLPVETLQKIIKEKAGNYTITEI
ncbi:MAG: heavy metal translocating P-type ATPase [Roseburia sp.]|nr:heavy metal translocating P-type ATPase [Roseburia sp.]